MKTLKLFPAGEIVLVLLFLVLANNFWLKKDRLIDSDGRGYYEYLPATFIYHDLKLGYLDTVRTDLYDDALMQGGFYGRVDGHRYDKYFAGTAIMQLPGFLAGHLYASFSGKYKTDGYSLPYQRAIYYANLLYLFFSLIFLRRLFQTYRLSRFGIFVLQAGIVFCGSLPEFIYWDAAFSHIYSFFLISVFLLAARTFFLSGSRSALRWMFVALALIVLVRPTNAMVLLFLPMLAGSWPALRDSFGSLFREHLKTTILSFLLFLAILQLQGLVWYFQSGHWIYMPYQGEGFLWSEPHFTDFLWSYRKGFFLWAPWFLLLFCVAVTIHAVRREWFRVISFLAAFCILIYVTSSWWFWSYGGSFGSRPMVDFYPVFAVFAAPVFAGKRFGNRILFPFTCVFAWIAIVQIYQYQAGIIRVDGMTAEEYRHVFLRTDDMFRGYLEQQKGPCDEKGALRYEKSWKKDFRLESMRWHSIDTLTIASADTSGFVGELSFGSTRNAGSEMLVLQVLDEKEEIVSTVYKRLLHTFRDPVKRQRGSFCFSPGAPSAMSRKMVILVATEEQPLVLQSLKLRLFSAP